MQVALNASAIRNILTLRYDPEKPSWDYQRRLKPADFMQPKMEFDSRELEALLKEGISESIVRQNPKHIVIPCGSGIDSTLILALTKEVFPGKITAISIGFNDAKDETRQALKLCESLGIDCHTAIIENPLQDLQRLIGIAKEPRFNLYWYYVVNLAKRLGADMILTGDGGDEVFAGYEFRYASYLKDIEHGHDRISAYLRGHNRDWVEDQQSIFGDSIRFDWKQVYSLLQPYFDNDLHPLNQVLLADFNGKLLYDFLPNNRAFYNHFNMANFAPFLDQKIIKYGLRLPLNQKYNKAGAGKLPLRALLDERGLRGLICKEKSGFGMDTVNLWRRHCRIAFRYDKVVRRGIINKSWIEQALPKAESDPRYTNKLLMIHALELYLS